jgi:hypothetical protein
VADCDLVAFAVALVDRRLEDKAMGNIECCTQRETDIRDLQAMRKSPNFRERWSDGQRLPSGRYRCKFQEEGIWKETVYTLEFLDDGILNGMVHENVQTLVLSFPDAPVPVPREFERELRRELGNLGVRSLQEEAVTCIRYADGILIQAANSPNGQATGVLADLRAPQEVIEALCKRISGFSVMGYAVRQTQLVPIEDVALAGAYNLWTAQVAWGEQFWWGSCEVLLQFGEFLPGRPVELRGTFCAVFEESMSSREAANGETVCDPFPQEGAQGNLVLISEEPYKPPFCPAP